MLCFVIRIKEIPFLTKMNITITNDPVSTPLAIVDTGMHIIYSKILTDKQYVTVSYTLNTHL